MPRRRIVAVQMSLPGVTDLTVGERLISVKNHKIPHREILRALQSSEQGGRGVVEIYRQEVLPRKTRTLRLLGRKSSSQIIQTLLGFEVKASFKRIHCPDLVTARYLKLFTELGCSSIKLPYDPTVTERLIPELEGAVNRLVSGVRQLFPQRRALQLYVIRRIYRLIRRQLQQE